MHHIISSVHELCERGDSSLPLDNCRDALKLLSSVQAFYGMVKNRVYLYALSAQTKYHLVAAAARMALYSARVCHNFSHIHKVCGHMSPSFIKWHRERSKNANFSDADMTNFSACVCGESRQTSTNHHKIHGQVPTRAVQYFFVDRCIHILYGSTCEKCEMALVK